MKGRVQYERDDQPTGRRGYIAMLGMPRLVTAPGIHGYIRIVVAARVRGRSPRCDGSWIDLPPASVQYLYCLLHPYLGPPLTLALTPFGSLSPLTPLRTLSWPTPL